MTTFVTHPSVRIRGTENNYIPTQCLDPNCHNKSPHMHCPFCIKTECYLDPVILKAHYRVKHVDKGLDFAGLKILRCCDHCDIVGAIKGEKKFKGAHWHCYKCKNGFNRRDEAIKHYKTHFRNPQTTFQIQITQEVNQATQLYENQETTHVISHDALVSTTTIHPVLTEAIMTTSSNNSNNLNNENDSSLANGKGEGEIGVTVAANETVASSEAHAIMIIHEEQLDNSHDVEPHTFSATLNNEGLQITSLLDVKMQLENRIVELQHQNQQLRLEKSQNEQQLQKEVEQLKLQIQMQASEIVNLQTRQGELLEQLNISVDDSLRQIMANMQAQHQELLHKQLAQLKQACLQKTHLFTQGSIALQVKAQPITSMTGKSVVMASGPDSNGHLIPIPVQLVTETSVLVASTETVSSNKDDAAKDCSSNSLKRTSELESNSDSQKRIKL